MPINELVITPLGPASWRTIDLAGKGRHGSRDGDVHRVEVVGVILPWMLSLQFGELPAFRGVVGKLIVGEDSPWNNVRSHMKSSIVGCASPGYISMVSSRRSHSGLSQRAVPGTLNVKN